MADDGRYAGLLAELGARAAGDYWTMSCPLPGRHRNGDRHPSCRLWVSRTRGGLMARCFGCGARWVEIVAATGTPLSAWGPFDQRQTTQGRYRPVGKVVATYSYYDADRQLVAQKQRLEPGPNGSKKSFRWRRPIPADRLAALNVDDGWVYGLDAGWYQPGKSGDRQHLYPVTGDPGPDAICLEKTIPGLYRLDSLVAAAFETPILFVEGEGKADRLVSLGFTATCGPGGASTWNQQWAGHFAGRKVVVFPDNNTAGFGHASVVAGSLLLAGAAGVKVVTPGESWPLKDNEDIGDWLAAIDRPKQRKAVLDLIGRFPSYLSHPVERRAA